MLRRVALASLLAVVGCAGSCEDESSTVPPPLLPGVALERSFGNLSFERPVFLTAAPGVADRVFVVEQGGRIFTFDPTSPSPSASVFLDLSAKVSRVGNEEGLLGLAFHPSYAENGRFFVHYSAPGLVSVVSELRVSRDDRDRADPSSEVKLFTQAQPYRNHNGGMLAFGPDGMLYVGFGDGGSAGDPEHRAQNLGTWLGKILRIDVDTPSESGGWSVPPDNPFVGVPGARPEIWAFGLRNPWRFSFDRLTGSLWAGDVGQDRFEEVDVITRGQNYGWRVFEGKERFDDDDELSTGSHAPPVAVYGRNEGKSITGGYVYRGPSLPLLQGAYVFGDFESGRIWALVPNASGMERRLLVESGKQIASFGEDAAGELYVCAFDGGIHRIVASDVEPPNLAPLPEKLSQTGMFADVAALAPATGVVSYEVNAPLWSDGAAKTRLLLVPTGQVIEFSPTGAWTFPDGTMLAKHLQRRDRRRRAPPRDAHHPQAGGVLAGRELRVERGADGGHGRAGGSRDRVRRHGTMARAVVRRLPELPHDRRRLRARCRDGAGQPRRPDPRLGGSGHPRGRPRGLVVSRPRAPG